MANSQTFLRMNHFCNAFSASWSWFVLILCLLQENVAYSQIEDDKDTKIYLDKLEPTKFNHLVVDKDREFVFIGAVDLLYQLSSDLELVASWRQDNSSLKCDDFKDVSNGVKKSIANYNKILVLDYYQSQLGSCWSTCDGFCKIYQIENPLREIKTVINPIVPRDENASTVALIVSNFLYVGVTVMTGQSKIPPISRRFLDRYSNFTIHENITLEDAYRGNYIINYIHGFSSDYFIYFLTTQMNSTQPSLYISKLIRVHETMSLSSSYAEIPIECFDDKERKYNLAQAAFVGKPGSELADSLGITPEDDVLFGIFAQSEKEIVGYESSKPSNRSAMCIYSLKEIDEKFTENIQRCSNRTGYRELELSSSPDQKLVEHDTSTGSDFGKTYINMPLECNSPVKTNASITFDTLVTAVSAQSYPNNFTAVFVGTNTGHLKQIVVENKFDAYQCKDMTIDEGFAINSDLHFNTKTNHLYIMTERKLTKVKINPFLLPSISSFKPTLGLFGDIVDITIIGDNLICPSNNTKHSIAVAGIPCTACRPLHSTEIVCTINTNSVILAEREEYEGQIEIRVNRINIKSEHYFVIFDPKIRRLFPAEGSMYGGNKLIIYGENFNAKSSVDVYIGNVSCLVFHHEQNEINCITGPSPVLKSKIAIKFDEQFRIFNYVYSYIGTDLDGKGHNLTLKGIPAGGLEIFIHNNLGLNNASIGKLFFQVNNNSKTYNSTKCKVENSTMFNCLSPHMPEIDSYSIDAENPQVFNYTLMVSLKRSNAGNPLLIKASKYYLYPNPVFEHYSVTELDENFRFVIEGRNIDNACRIDDFIVRLGDENCKVLKLSRSALICWLQKSTLRYNYSKNTAELDFSAAYGNLTVQIGNNAEQVVPYFNAVPIVSTEKLWSEWIIYGLCFGAFILIIIFIALIKLLFAYRKKSFKSSKMSREMQKQINRMGMDAIEMRQCIKQIVVEKKIDVDGNLANILKLPNITIEYTPVSETNVETSPEMEFYLPLDTEWEFPREKLVLGRFLGEGEFGRVVESEASGIIDDNITTTVAVKMLKVKHSDADMINLVSELEIMKLIGMHPNVLRLLGCCTQNGPLLIITEYAVHGNLLSFLHKHVASENFETVPSELSQRTLVTFGLQVAQGMEYLSSMKCVHRDLAARNILVSDNQILKIADFGLARDIKSKDYYRKKSGGRLPVKWMAPEALLRRLYTVQSDVWSYGILLWEIMTLGGSPYPTFTDMKKLLRDIHSGYRMEKPPDCSMEMYSIMRHCWNYLPTDRPSFSMIVENLEEILQNSGDNDILEESDSYESSM